MSLEIAMSLLEQEKYFKQNPSLFAEYNIQTIADEGKLSFFEQQEYNQLKHDLIQASSALQQAIARKEHSSVLEFAHSYIDAYSQLAIFKKNHDFTYISVNQFYELKKQTTNVEEAITRQLATMHI